MGQSFYESNHAKVSQAHLASLQGSRPYDWVLAVGGHHGKYPSPHARLPKLNEGQQAWPAQLRGELLKELMAAFGPLPDHNIAKGPWVHWLTGFITFCDWIGSDTRWFPLATNGPLADHETSDSAKAKAILAVGALGWHRREVHPGMSFSALFPGINQPRPLQEALISAMDNPGLYIVEAPMGIGKTEAALAGAYRRWTEGGERGLYFALPTQLTSNRIHDRVSDFLSNVVSDISIHALVHGNAWMHPDRILSISPTTNDEEGAADLSDWYASGRKALLAGFGTGTIDQALMACLPVKHSALRLFALSGKVIIIDEVHSYDPYTSALVDKTVKWLLEVGCTLIVLSATLSSSRRQSLLEAAGAKELQASTAYPLITKVKRGHSVSETISVPSANLASFRVQIEQTAANADTLWPIFADAAEQGACIVIIRNTVALAQETFRQLKSRCRDRDLPFGLLHSRFPQFQRDENEKFWMNRLGKHHESRPHGCILVATQVIEQSVDIDADLLVTDIAPIDLILQRLGRLHRHPRPRPLGFAHPRCLILTPPVDWAQDEKSIQAALGPSAFVYPPFSLYQAGRILAQIYDKTIRLPEDIRTLIEQSCQVPPLLPAGAKIFRDKLDKLTREMLGTAQLGDVFHAPTENDKEGAKTRWNDQPSALLVLLRHSFHPASEHLHFLNGERIPFRMQSYSRFDYPLAMALHRNAVRVPRYLIRHALPKQPEWLGKHIEDAVLAIIPTDSTICQLVGAEENAPFQLQYHPETGIFHTRQDQIRNNFPSDLCDDNWF